MASTSTDKAPAAKQKRGEGPYVINFMTTEQETAKRCPPNPTAVVVNFKAGGTTSIDLSTIDAATLKALAAYGLQRRLDGVLRTVEDDSDLTNATAEFVSAVNSGKLFSTKEKGEGGGQRGKPFDYDHWAAVMVAAAKVKKKEIGPQKVIDLLKSLSPKDRAAMVAKWRKDRNVQTIDLRLRAEKAKKSDSTFDAFEGDDF